MLVRSDYNLDKFVISASAILLSAHAQYNIVE
jgi:hypothetical protein